MIEKKIPSDAVRWAFEIHKDADALLHSRLQGFLAFNALLAGGFFLTAREPLDNGIASALAVLPCAVGLTIGLLFPRGIARIVDGVIRLKEKWLIHDPAYRLYYGDHNVAPDGKVKLGYGFAKGAPWVILGFWIVAAMFTLARLTIHFGAAAWMAWIQWRPA